jgi:hypothetical protein
MSHHAEEAVASANAVSARKEEANQARLREEVAQATTLAEEAAKLAAAQPLQTFVSMSIGWQYMPR